MTIKEILPYTERSGFRQWLSENHHSASECWIIVKKGKSSPTGVLPYLDGVEEALCFGWIDSTVKTTDGQTIQRFSPRKKGSPWSELNKARCRRLEKLGLMTEAGRKVLPDIWSKDMEVDADIVQAFEQHEAARKNFRKFPELYRRVRIDTIQRDKKKNPELFRKRLERLIQASEEGKMIGEWNDSGLLPDHAFL